MPKETEQLRSQLRSLACRVRFDGLEGRTWYDGDGAPSGVKDDDRFIAAASPDAVIALLDEIERLQTVLLQVMEGTTPRIKELGSPAGPVEREAPAGLTDKVKYPKHRPTVTIYLVWDRQLCSYVEVDGLLVRTRRGNWERWLGVDQEIHRALVCPEGIEL